MTEPSQHKKYRFTGMIKSSGRGGMFVDIPFDVEKEFGKKRVKISATFDGEPYKGSLVRYGSPDYFLIILKSIREKIGKGEGELIDVTLMEDLSPRIVELPEDFKQILNKNLTVKEFYNKLSYTHQKEYVNWITNAKKEETRIIRMNKAIELMKAGKKGK